MADKQKPKTDYFDFFIVIAFFWCLAMAGITYYHDEPITLYKRGIHAVLDDNTHFVLNYEIQSTTFSAQKMLSIKVDGWGLDDFSQKHKNELNKIDIIFIYFLGSTTTLDVKTENGVFGPNMILKKGDDGRFHGGPYELTYPEEGEKCILLALEKQSSAPTSCSKEQAPFLIISPLSDTLQNENNKIILALTWAVIGFTLISVRDPLRILLHKFFIENQPKPKNEKN